MRAFREIRHYQEQDGLLLNRLPFARVVREVIHDVTGGVSLRIQSTALAALQEATEAFLVGWFQCLQSSAVHGRRVTIMMRDSGHVANLARQMIGSIVPLANLPSNPASRRPIDYTN